MLRARVFGTMAVWVDDRPLPAVPGLRPRSLLAFLLLHPGMHPRTRLAGRFWPDVMEASARASLRSALWTLRTAFEAVGGGEHLHADRLSVGVGPASSVHVDALEFARLEHAGDLASLVAAYELCGGPLLADLAEEWALDLQDGHRLRLAEVCERLATAAEEAGDLGAAVRWSRAAIQHDRLGEARHRALMRRLAVHGERGLALDAYRRAQTTLVAELGIAPSRETRELAASLREPGARVTEPSAPVAATRARGAIVGRGGELAALMSCWARVRGGRGGVVVISGPAGIGKTRLLEELVGRARANGAVCAGGSALPIEGAPALGPWTELIREVSASHGPPRERWAADLARLMPAAGISWDGSPAPPPGSPELERLRLFEAIARLLEWVARDRPLLVALEDLHWSDPTSLTLLAHIGRQLGASPIMVVVTHRHDRPPGGLAAALEAVRRVGDLLLDLPLTPMPPDDVHRLVVSTAPAIPSAVVPRLVALANGSPFVARQAAVAAAKGGDGSEGVLAVVRSRLNVIGEDARRVLEVVSAAGRPLRVGELACATEEAALFPAIEDALATGMLERLEDGRLALVHDLLRDSLLHRDDPRRVAVAHRMLAEGLVRQPGRSNAEIGRHLELAGDGAAAARYLVAAAGDARRVGALEEAIAALRRALEIGAASDADAAEMWLALADACAWSADRAGMDAAFSRAVEILDGQADRVGVATAHAFRARWLHTTLCFPAEALGAARCALEAIGDDDRLAPEAALIARTSAAWAEAVVGDPAAVDGLVDASRRVLEGMGDRLLEAELEQVRGIAEIRNGRFTEGAQTCARAAELARLAGRHEVAAVAMVTAAAALACTGDLARVLALLDTASQWPSPGRSLDLQLRAARAYTLSQLGLREAAEREARRNLEVAARTGDTADNAVAAFDLGSILLDHGAARDAAQLLAAALEVPDSHVPRALARLRLAGALAKAGRPEEAAAALEEVAFTPVRPADFPETLVARMSHAQGLVAAARGDRRLATRRFDEAERAWRRIAADSGDRYTAVLVDLGRPPVAGLVRPELELSRLAADREALTTERGG